MFRFHGRVKNSVGLAVRAAFFNGRAGQYNAPNSLSAPIVFGVLDSDGNSFTVPSTVRDSDGNSFTVTATVRDSDGNSFTVS